MQAAGWIMLPTLLGTFILISLSYLWSRSLLKEKTSDETWYLTDHIGAGNWDFNSSWASTLTVATSALTAILSIGTLPSYLQVSEKVNGELSEKAKLAAPDGLAPLYKEDFLILSLMFALLIPAATLVYNATRTPEPIPDPTDPNNSKHNYQYQGYVWSFLVASGMVIWATNGQLITIIVLCYELHKKVPPYIPVSIFVIFLVLLAAALLVVNFYAWKSIPWTLLMQDQHKKNPQEELRKTDKPLKPELPKWALP